MSRHPHPSSRVPVRRSVVTVLLGALVAVVALVVGPADAAQAANYRFWGYWQLTNGAWAFAQTGPDQAKPADGAVEGWRFAVDDGTGTRTPRVTPTFAQLCNATPAQEGKKRVGVVLDSGRDVDGETGATPPALVATCVVVPTAATGAEVLAAAGPVRAEKGLICAINGYPATGCGGEVPTLTDAQKAKDTPLTLPTPSTKASAAATTSAAGSAAPSTTSDGSGFSPVAALLTVLVLLGILAAFLASRRRRSGV